MSEALPHGGCSTRSSTLYIREFAVAIYRENLPQEMPWEFAVAICRMLFLYL